MPKDYAVRDVKAKDHDVLEIVYTETGRDGEYGPKLTFSNTDIVYRMGMGYRYSGNAYFRKDKLQR